MSLQKVAFSIPRMDAEIRRLQQELVLHHNRIRLVFDYSDLVQIHPILICSTNKIQLHEFDQPSLPVE